MKIKELITSISSLALDRIASLAKSKMLDNSERKNGLMTILLITLMSQWED